MPVVRIVWPKKLNEALPNSMSKKQPDIIESSSTHEELKLENIQQSLHRVENKLDLEIRAKQTTIERQEQEIKRLYRSLEEKEKVIVETGERLAECMRNGEGNRQLINKLLNDIDRLHQDIEWYKRTYEKRSILGTIKQKIIKKRK
jgi:hypothetical protein